ncbi:hypothetical protein [Roseospira visakhapatnamensis]|uniref:Uncharacterized protein n=1 Tax=Roseospira visakhapatnamensis TaxID=390880 RepID=A0A7W6RAH5_9PROT|nr:hypothetical protein [Roseospira visakhapatnamensis]MBB4264938.1 hypothetical protein [Roseospira visakhapatnamensis]
MWKMILGTIVALGTSAIIVIYLDSISEKTAASYRGEGVALEGGWTGTLPTQFKGIWVVGGDCDSEHAPLIVMSNGGYRWRDGPTNWGYARGHYKFDSPASNKLMFRLSKLNSPHDGTPDYIITVSGVQLKKYNLKSRTEVEYEKCPE